MSATESKQPEMRNGGQNGTPLPANGLVFTALTLIGLYLCYRLALPFLPAIVWALTLAVLFSPLQRRLEINIGHPNAATALTVLAVAVIVVLPSIFVASHLLDEISKGAELVRKYASNTTLRETLEKHHFLAPIGAWIERQIDLPETFGRIATWLTNTAAAIVRGSVTKLTGLLLTFYLLFYFLRDRQRALGSLRALFPLSPGEMDRVFERVTDTIHATVYGTLTVAAVQGALGGLMFWFLGLPAPLLWGIVMALLAVIPVLGAFIIWIPAALWLASQGHWGKALLLTAWGGIVVAGIDNLIYPVLVGNRLQQHTILAFISLVGGLIVFGSSGVILGPLSLTITLLLLEIRHDRKPPDA
jgi:predicted PurR-regulated permease PerM